MKLQVLCSSGIFFRAQPCGILVDVPNSAFSPFYELPESELQKIIDAKPPYDVPLCLAFTHLHRDHYSQEKTDRILKARPDCKRILPSAAAQTYELFEGVFTLETYPAAHTPAPGFENVIHNVLYITAEKSVYVCADAAPDAALHRLILDGRKPDVSFFNSQYLSYPETRSLLAECSQQCFIYHIPANEPDPSGIRKKAVHNTERFGSELSSVKPILSYPFTITD